MDVISYSDPALFVEEVWPWLTEKEAENCLIIGVSGAISRAPERFEGYRQWTVVDESGIVAAALIAPPANVMLADTGNRAAVAALASALHEEAIEIPGVIANSPTADWFTDAWKRSTGVDAEVTMAQGLFRLDRVEIVPAPKGHAREATESDIDVLALWLVAFRDEAVPHNEPLTVDSAKPLIERRLDNPDTGMWVWDHEGQVVSMSGHGGPTPNGIRIAPVYTPPDLRGNGYATALVAHQSQDLLDSGRRFCFLYTDLSNPTSNAIYERIGYKRIADSAEIRFTAGE